MIRPQGEEQKMNHIQFYAAATFYFCAEALALNRGARMTRLAVWLDLHPARPSWW